MRRTLYQQTVSKAGVTHTRVITGMSMTWDSGGTRVGGVGGGGVTGTTGERNKYRTQYNLDIAAPGAAPLSRCTSL